MDCDWLDDGLVPTQAPRAIKFKKGKERVLDLSDDDCAKKNILVDIEDAEDDDAVLLDPKRLAKSSNKAVLKSSNQTVLKSSNQTVVDLVSDTEDADDESSVIFTDKKMKMKPPSTTKTSKTSTGSGEKPAAGKKKSSERKLYHSKIYKETLKLARCAGKGEDAAKAKARKISLLECQKRFGS